MEEPTRRNDRKDKDDPILAQSMIDKEKTDPRRVKPKTDKADPKRATLRNDIDAPM